MTLEMTEIERAPPNAPTVLPSIPSKQYSPLRWTMWPQRRGNHWVVVDLSVFKQPCSKQPMGIYSIGPHWPGVVFVIALLVGSTQYICSTWPWASWPSVLFCVVCFVLLALTSCTDPGFVSVSATATDDSEELCFCEDCQLYRPDSAFHCDYCGRCVDGWDHHCVWMGQCIGKDNYKIFWRFNVAWLLYLGFLLYLTSMDWPLSLLRSLLFCARTSYIYFISLQQYTY